MNSQYPRLSHTFTRGGEARTSIASRPTLIKVELKPHPAGEWVRAGCILVREVVVSTLVAACILTALGIFMASLMATAAVGWFLFSR